MKPRVVVLGILASAFAATNAPAQVQGINLTGQYKCVAACAGNSDAFITQYGWQLKVTSDAGAPSRA